MEKRSALQRHTNHQGIGRPETRQGLSGFFMPVILKKTVEPGLI